jgi:hypothetical protein
MWTGMRRLGVAVLLALGCSSDPETVREGRTYQQPIDEVLPCRVPKTLVLVVDDAPSEAARAARARVGPGLVASLSSVIVPGENVVDDDVEVQMVFPSQPIAPN